MNYIAEITAIENLVTTNLADASDITPAELRDTLTSMITFLRKTSPLASGVSQIGDVDGTNQIRTIALPYDVGTSDYYVVGSLVSKSADYNVDNDVFEMIKDKTTNSFKLCLREIASVLQDIDFEWAIYPKNT